VADRGARIAFSARLPGSRKRGLKPPAGSLTLCDMVKNPRRWFLGGGAGATDEDGMAAFTAEDLLMARGKAGVALGFHEAVCEGVPAPAEEVVVEVPAYRGKAFLPVLSWLVIERLGASGASVEWHVDRKQGPASVARLLASLGWDLTKEHAGRVVVLRGRAPDKADQPAPREFQVSIGGADLSLAADYGVFSPGALDAGTELLLNIALQSGTVDVVADIGTGYGPLAIGLVAAGIASRSVATDIDCVALWLAGRNARANGTPLTVECSPEPAVLAETPLTVCNVPTHINAERTRRLMTGLLARAIHGRLLVVVHTSLEARYARYFAAAGLRAERYPGPTHVVLAAGQ
jgi:16S rRNA G1207 methylase RsmC